jgi:site-specific recombinase XerD
MSKRKIGKLPRGIFERDKGSGVYWIRFTDQAGKKRREKVGSFKAAEVKLAQRKTGVLEGRKLPETLRVSAQVTVSDLIDLVLQFTSHHKSMRDYISKAKIVRAALGNRPADELKPQDLELWLKRSFKTAATQNRYKSFIGLAFRQGMRNGKVSTNPARMVQQRKEGGARLRFLSRAEYDRLHAVIAKRFPEHLAEFEVSVHTGMRLTEQYSAKWGQYEPGRKVIELKDTKNSDPRTMHLNAVAVAAVESLKLPGQKKTDPIFPREGSKDRFDTRSWFVPCLAEAEIEGYLWHSNRHTFCSWLAMAGASIKEIQELAGHKTIAMSARYAHLSQDHKMSVVERIATDTTNPNGHQNGHRPEQTTG